jgi:hypothetical protein
MAGMAIPAPTPPAAAAHHVDRRLIWLAWIGVTLIGSVLASQAGWQLRWIERGGSIQSQQVVIFLSAIIGELILGGGQWLVLWRHKVDAYWWIPASVIGNVVAALLVVPAVTSLALRAGIVQPLNHGGALAFGIVSLATSGVVVGFAQALVFRPLRGGIAWIWIPATVLGGAIAATLTNALSPVIIQAMPIVAFPDDVIGALAAVGALAVSACQAPILVRLLR